MESRDRFAIAYDSVYKLYSELILLEHRSGPVLPSFNILLRRRMLEMETGIDNPLDILELRLAAHEIHHLHSTFKSFRQLVIQRSSPAVSLRLEDIPLYECPPRFRRATKADLKAEARTAKLPTSNTPVAGKLSSLPCRGAIADKHDIVEIPEDEVIEAIHPGYYDPENIASRGSAIASQKESLDAVRRRKQTVPWCMGAELDTGSSFNLMSRQEAILRGLSIRDLDDDDPGEVPALGKSILKLVGKTIVYLGGESWFPRPHEFFITSTRIPCTILRGDLDVTASGLRLKMTPSDSANSSRCGPLHLREGVLGRDTLLDTGLYENAISSEIVTQHGLWGKCSFEKSEFEDIAGQTLCSPGYLDLPVCIGNTTHKERFYILSLQSGKASIIIGRQTMKSYSKEFRREHIIHKELPPGASMVNRIQKRVTVASSGANSTTIVQYLSKAILWFKSFLKKSDGYSDRSD